jgi:hypothetical protein
MALLQLLLPIERPRCPRCRDMSAPCPVTGHRESVASAPRDAAFHPALPHCEKSRPGVTPSGFLMRLPVRHCSGSVASIGKTDAVWLTKDYRICSDKLMRATGTKVPALGLTSKKSRRMSWIEQLAAQNAESEWSRLSPSRAAPTSNA